MNLWLLVDHQVKEREPHRFNARTVISLPRQELLALIGSLTEQMRSSAADLQFELAARLRDEIRELKKELRGMDEAGI